MGKNKHANTKISPKEVFDTWWQKLFSNVDMKTFDMDQFVQEFLLSSGNVTVASSNNIDELDMQEFEGSWKHVNYLVRMFKNIYGDAQKYAWNTDQVGTLFLKGLNVFLQEEDCKILVEDIYKLVKSTFTMPEEGIGLPEIVELFSVEDFKALTTNSSSAKSAKPSTMKKSFTECFDHILIMKGLNFEVKEEYFDDSRQTNAKFLEKSPCQQTVIDPKCSEYCNWHKDFVSKTSNI